LYEFYTKSYKKFDSDCLSVLSFDLSTRGEPHGSECAIECATDLLEIMGGPYNTEKGLCNPSGEGTG